MALTRGWKDDFDLRIRSLFITMTSISWGHAPFGFCIRQNIADVTNLDVRIKSFVIIVNKFYAMLLIKLCKEKVLHMHGCSFFSGKFRNGNEARKKNHEKSVLKNRRVGVAETSLSTREIFGSIPGPIKSHTGINGSPLQRRFSVAQTLSHGDGPRHSSHASL